MGIHIGLNGQSRAGLLGPESTIKIEWIIGTIHFVSIAPSIIYRFIKLS